ncbi:hypothetical protein GCM10007304_44680 [Rhodococcoides trifolii]|uniref:Uncharacterized protein n=1 Tax=Rhodococcoides trifolii TaxID=908250 RepID=A0A917G711_9NOCA|nr:hypothetical protein GCM10007304_44680 [Rhodococcus trifolii]
MWNRVMPMEAVCGQIEDTCGGGAPKGNVSSIITIPIRLVAGSSAATARPCYRQTLLLRGDAYLSKSRKPDTT